MPCPDRVPAGRRPRGKRSPLPPPPPRERFLEAGTVIHAAGAVVSDRGETLLGANCLEGLTASYEAGDRFVEIDFNFTADGELVCIHDWQPKFSDAIVGTEPLSLAEFMACRIYGSFTPMSLETLADFMEAHPDLCVVTDIKERNVEACGLIAARYPDLRDRFLIQIYDRDLYGPVRELGFESIIFTLYMLDWNSKTDTAALADFARDHELLAYTFGAPLADREHYVEEMLETGVPLFVHTVNGPETRQRFLDMGITGVYTDYGSGFSDPPEETR